VDSAGNIKETLERDYLCAVQTPQIFLKDWYMRALERAVPNAPDDCYILESAGYKIAVVECSRYNFKVTDGQDVEFLSRINGC
jgi:2-C-methyl-D-erythritol 4-phosphate cytidylyltransferase